LSYKAVISIHGAPRSGTSWLGQIFDSSPNVRYKFQPLFSYAFKDRINLQSTKEEFMKFLDELYNKQDPFLDQLDKKEDGRYPIFKIKEENPPILVMKMVRYHYLIPHLISNVPNIKIIGIVRHPCAVLNSWRKAPREFLNEWNFNEEWMFAQSKNKFRPEEYYGYHRWKELTMLFLELEKHQNKSFKLVKYEDLVRNTEIEVNNIFDFCGIDIHHQTEEFLYQSTHIHQSDEYSVYKGNKNIRDWEKELPPEIISYIENDLKGTELERFVI
jgi:hypothetical protein